MAELEVYPGEEVRVVSTGLHDDNDYSGLFATTSGPNKKREVETGFKNTALLMHYHDPQPASDAGNGGSGGERSEVGQEEEMGSGRGGGDGGEHRAHGEEVE